MDDELLEFSYCRPSAAAILTKGAFGTLGSSVGGAPDLLANNQVSHGQCAVVYCVYSALIDDVTVSWIWLGLALLRARFRQNAI